VGLAADARCAARACAYGVHTDPVTGETTSRAWCEAIVQRIPEYFAAELNEPWARGDELLLVNAQMGRKYRITHFRWLQSDEI